MKPKFIPFAILAVLLSTSCSEESTPQTPTTVTNVSVPVSADQGGEVIIGNATLTIPPGALDEDTVITVEMRAAQDIPANTVVKGMVFDFGPNGLKFNQPAVLEFDLPPNTFSEPGAISKYDPNLGLWDQFGPTGSVNDPNLGLWDQTGDSGDNYDPNLGLWDQNDPNMMASGVTGFSDFASTLPGHGVYSCGVDDIGLLCCWGLQVSDCTDCQPAGDPVPTSSEFIAVAPGAWSDCGLKGDGTVECWGSNPPVPPTTGEFVELATGRGHACGLKEDGTIECFMAADRNYVVPSPSQSDFAAVTAGDFHACGLRSTGEIECWGPARDGEADAPSGMGFVDVDAGARHTCAVTGSGTLECWGSDISGIKQVPTRSAETFTQVSVGVFAACALTSVGGVVCWGADTDVVTGTPSQTGYTQVIARHRQACAVNSAGAIECWGQDISGSLAPPAGCGFPTYTPTCEIGFVDSGMGCMDVDECMVADTCDMNATCTNTPGSFECMCDAGFDGDGFTCTEQATNRLLAGGSFHTCTIRGGAILCWGENDYGQLGDGTGISSAAAVQVGTATDWEQIAAGADHTCAINTGGELWCWGSNFGGALGDGTFDQRNAPVRESTSATNWAQVTAGYGHTCALNTNGEIYCWGEGFGGKLGDGMSDSQEPNPLQEATNATNWAAVEAGGEHTCALDVMGNLSCWGANFMGQLGNGMSGQDGLTPTQVGGGPWDSVSLGGAHTCATRGGELYCWGAGMAGQLGIGGNGGDEMGIPTPNRVGTDVDWSILAAGGDNTCALKTSGALFCWGGNLEGQLGVGDTNDRNVPTRVGMFGDWSSIEVPVIGQQACGLRENGDVLCWGANFGGQLGVESSRLAPGAGVDPGVNWSSVSAFGGEDVPFNLGISSYACGIKTGAPWCWGWSGYDSLAGTTTQVTGTNGNMDWTKVSSSSTHSCGLQNSAPRCWGDNADGGLGDGSNTASASPVIAQGTGADTDWTDVSAGSGFSCGIKSGGLWCWGRGLEGQLGDGQQTSLNAPVETGSSTGSMWTTVSAGHTHVCAIQNSELYCWGDNATGQLGNGLTTPETVIPAMPTVMGTSFVSVAAGREHSCAIDMAGNLLCTGDNTNGELGDGSLNPSTTFVPVGGAQAPWSSVSVGRDHTCGVASGMAYCWGANFYGQLGDGTITNANAPVAVSTAFTDWEEVSVGDVFTCGRRTGGQVLCWGDNGQGQMGDGSLRFLTPQTVSLP